MDILNKKRHILYRAVEDLLKNEVIEGVELIALRESVSHEADTEASDQSEDTMRLAA